MSKLIIKQNSKQKLIQKYTCIQELIFTNVFSNNHYKIVFNIYKKYNTKELIDWVNLLSNFLMDYRNRIRYTILEISIIFGLQYQIKNETKK